MDNRMLQDPLYLFINRQLRDLYDQRDRLNRRDPGRNKVQDEISQLEKQRNLMRELGPQYVDYGEF